MPLYEYECAQRPPLRSDPEGHRKTFEEVLRSVPPARRRAISQPTLLHNRGVHVFDRVTKDDALRDRPSSLKSFKKDKF